MLARLVFALLAVPGCGGTPTTDSDAADTDTDSDTDTDTDSDTDTDTDATPGFYRVDDAGGQVLDRSADVAVAADGTIYVTWADARSGDADVRIARSTDGGATFEPSIALDGEERLPLVSMARRPYVAADDDRVAVVFNQQEPFGISLYVSSRSGALDFGEPIALGTDLVDATFHDFPKAIFRDGEIHVAWQTYSTDAWMVLARETEAYAAVQADAASSGIPCECCPIDLAVAAGDVLLAFRNNEENQREHWVARSVDGGAVTGVAQVSDTEGMLFTCPMEGPRLHEVDGDVHAVWSNASGDGETFIATSADGGDSWSASRKVADLDGTSEPTITSSETGLWVTLEDGDESRLALSTDGGASFGAPVELVSPDGPLGDAQADSAAGVVVVVGTTPSGQVWLYRIE